MHANRQKRVYYHETRDVCDGLPDLLHRFPLRALIAAKPGERVVLPVGLEPKELPLLNELGFGPRPEDVITVRDDGSIASGDRDLEGAELRPFSGVTSLARAFARRHGLSFMAPPRAVCVEANSKAFFQNVAEASRETGGPAIAPKGATATREDVSDVIERMLGSCERVVVKGVASASGLQQLAVSRGDTVDPEDLARLPDELVVQEWFRHDSSPSMHCILATNGVTRMLYCSRQLLDGRQHTGNVYEPDDAAIPEWARKQMQAVARAISRAYSGTMLGSMPALGYWGPLGIDFMIDEQRQTVLAAEVNARIAAPWYSWQASRRRFGSALPFRTKSYRLKKGTAIGDVAAALSSLLFDRRKMQGAVPFCFVPEHGFVYGTTYAFSGAELPALAERTDAAMADLAP